ncbi:AraC family transcriptional regulator [Cohnella cholangitidis]|uniref:Helix-turn-helix domain-containing protein n=1 Tax=Cohnella cholangitidis TaxID=2598458 RepID=A0A7G5C3X9_9BACL|nr:AraC family transcriptional regulator [Cohnella cholangitidis]QMV43913.1 helix-turn-helix domain-containing protein [Cohnella cholangitidis]
MTAPYSVIHDLFRPDSVHLLHTPNMAASMLPLRIFACGHYYCLNGYRVERQGLDNRLMVLTLAGKGQITYRGVTHPLARGQVFLIDCNEKQQYESVGDYWEIQWVRFEENTGVDYEFLINAGRFQPIALQRLGYVETRLRAILQQANHHAPAADLIMAEALCGILTAMYEDKHVNDTLKLSSSAAKAISETVIDMERHFAEDISIKELARKIHMTTYAFIRLFKRQTGLTPYEYILKARITKARIMLEQTDLSVTEISEQVGFRNANNFIRKFKMLANTTPLQYRRLNGSLYVRDAGDH